MTIENTGGQPRTLPDLPGRPLPASAPHRPGSRLLIALLAVTLAGIWGIGSPASGPAGAAIERRGAWSPVAGEALAGGAWGTGTLTGDEILDLVSRMTLSEEIAMVQGASDTTCPGVYVSPSVQGCMGQAGYVPGVARLGIPPLRLADGPAGVKLSHVATALPSPIGLAATFDRNAALLYGQVMGREGRAINQDVILAPMINQVSIPTAGRNFETLGEDPYLMSELVGPQVAGIQGEGLIATLKHFLMNDFENGRTTTSVRIDEASLHEMELLAFRSGIAAGAGAVMCAYGRVNDVYSCSSNALLNRTLKGTLGFAGWVMTDWGAARRTSDLVHGLDMAMPSGTLFNGWDAATLGAAVANGTAEVALTNDYHAVPAYSASEWKAALDGAVFRILSQMNKARLLEGTIHGSELTGGAPWVPPRPDLEALRPRHEAIARALAGRSAVLLKNEAGALPLEPGDFTGGGAGEGVLLIGPTAVAPYTGGWGSAHVRPFDPVESPYDALVAAAGPGANVGYVHGYDLDGVVVPYSALAAPDVANPYPHWTLRAEDEPFSGQPGLLRQQITTQAVPFGAQPVLHAGAGAAPDRLDATVDYLEGDALPPGSAWRWTGTFTAPADGEWRLKVFVSRQTRADLFIDGLEEARRAFEIRAYPAPPQTSYAALDHTARSHDLGAPHLQQATYAVSLTAGQQLHLDLRLVTGTTMPSEIQLRWIPPGWQDEKIAEAVAAAASACKVVVFAIDEGFEGRDRGGDDPSAGLVLGGSQDALISAVASVNPATVVVLNVGAPVLMPWAGDVEAILVMWFPGQMGGAATADVLLGGVNPGGRLPVTFPPDGTQFPQFDPACTDRSIHGNCPLYPGHATQGFLGSEPHGYRSIDFSANGLHVGYRWFDREGLEPLFAFGHGISYTAFEYSDLRLLRARKGGIQVRFWIRNAGSRPGEEVVQVYVGPSGRAGGAAQAARRLVQFERVALAPGEMREVSLHVTPRDLSHWSEGQEDWRVAGGSREVFVGSSSRDIRLQGTVRLGP